MNNTERSDDDIRRAIHRIAAEHDPMTRAALGNSLLGRSWFDHIDQIQAAGGYELGYAEGRRATLAELAALHETTPNPEQP